MKKTVEAHILLVDDDNEYAETFKSDAVNYNINVLHVRSFDKMKIILPKISKQIASVILDIKGIVEDNQVSDEVDFLPTALTLLDSEYRTLPRFIITGDSDRFKSFSKLFSKEQVFIKDDIELLFKSIKPGKKISFMAISPYLVFMGIIA